MKEIIQPSITAADLMNPGNSNNTLDQSGRGVDWNPRAVLAALEEKPTDLKGPNNRKEIHETK